MIFDIVTLFPGFFNGPLNTGLIDRAVKSGIASFNLVNLREYAAEGERCDDYPYGGGSGMVLKPGPIYRATSPIKERGARVILTTPSGTPLNQKKVRELAEEKELCVICGHYEGVDRRAVDLLVDDEISVGDYILSGGEFAALIIVDAVIRYCPGFMSNPESLEEESFEDDLLEYPHYTRPPVFMGMAVPDLLIEGDHKKIAQWRRSMREEKTKRLRPDLYKEYIKRLISGDK